MADKVSSEHPEIYIKCVQTPKLIDYIREPWGFKGVLVKFKSFRLVLPKTQSLDIARKSRKTSSADLIVANCLDDFNQPSPNMYICGDGLLVESTRIDLPTECSKTCRGICKMNIILAGTGSVAAIKDWRLMRALKELGDVKGILTIIWRILCKESYNTRCSR